MKKVLLFFAFAIIATALFAQNHDQKHQCKETVCITKMVSNLTNNQKRQLEAIEVERQKSTCTIKKQLHSVRDSIHFYLEQFGDNTTVVYPLLKRESVLQYQLNMINYDTKVKMDKILTPEQQKEFRQNLGEFKQKESAPQRPKPHAAAPPVTRKK